jgi:hypothetical protein
LLSSSSAGTGLLKHQRFGLALDFETAKALGIEVPPTPLAIAEVGGRDIAALMEVMARFVTVGELGTVELGALARRPS